MYVGSPVLSTLQAGYFKERFSPGSGDIKYLTRLQFKMSLDIRQTHNIHTE